MRIGGNQFPVFNPYKKPAYEIYISGCNRNCFNCHTKDLQDFEYGDKIVIDEFLRKLKERTELYKVISILGGDLLCQDLTEAKDFSMLLRVSFPNKELWLFTGAEIEEVPNWAKDIFDYIKTGKYIEKIKQEGFPASSNQKLLKKGIDY